VTPNQASSACPISPDGANSSSSSQPVTTGGNTNGRCTSASSNSLPGNTPRASTQASAKAIGNVTTIAAMPTFNVNRMIGQSAVADIASEASSG
jgi:hypothetical protein